MYPNFDDCSPLSAPLVPQHIGLPGHHLELIGGKGGAVGSCHDPVGIDDGATTKMRPTKNLDIRREFTETYIELCTCWKGMRRIKKCHKCKNLRAGLPPIIRTDEWGDCFSLGTKGEATVVPAMEEMVKMMRNFIADMLGCFGNTIAPLSAL